MEKGDDPRAQPASTTDSIARQAQQRIVVRKMRDSFRTPQDEAIAQDILNRNRETRIESHSRISRAFMTKSKRTKFSQREIFRALASVVIGYERAGPGVVEVLRDQLILGGGDINFTPPKKSFGSVFRKDHEERSGLLQTATRLCNVEVVQLLSRYSDKVSLDNSLENALRNRDASTTDRGAKQEDQMIQILISYGADGSSTISAAVAIGDETLLRMLLAGQPPEPKLSEALPLSVALRDPTTRSKLIRMLLEKGADVNYDGGEAMLLATKVFDMPSLDMLLERRPRAPSLSRAFATSLNIPDSNNRFEACQKLMNAGAVGNEVNKGLTIAVTSEYQNVEFLKLILLSASVDFQHGHALCLAIANDYEAHLRLMLDKRPNETTFDAAFVAAMRLRNPRDQLKYCRVLAEAGPVRDSCSKALIVAIKSQKEELCKFFLGKGASPDFDGGASIIAATQSENIGILELLVAGRYQMHNNASLVSGFETALSVPSQSKKMKLLKLFLDAGLKGPPLDVALVNTSKQGVEGSSLCELLLEHGASVNAQGGEALDVVRVFCIFLYRRISYGELLASMSTKALRYCLGSHIFPMWHFLTPKYYSARDPATSSFWKYY